MKRLNLLLSVFVITLFISCESEFEPINADEQSLIKKIADDPIPVDLCDFPELPDTCPAPTEPGDPDPQEVPHPVRDVEPIAMELLDEYGACLDAELNDPNLAPFMYNGEVYEYEENGDNPEAILALTSIAFHFVTDLEGVVVTTKGPAGDFAKRLLRCLVQVAGIGDLRKLIKHYQNGRLTKKMLFRIIKRNLVRKLGWVGAAISFCELLTCMAK